MNRVLITRPREDAAALADLLRAAGFQPVLFPTIAIRPLEENTAWQRALAKLECYDWLVFTSAHAVAALPADLPPSLRNGRDRAPRIAAIGAKTAAALRTRGLEPDLVPQPHTAEALAAALGDLSGRWVLFPAADIARPTLPQAVIQAGGVMHQITVYRTLPAAPDPAGLAALQSGVDWLTFTSPSTVRNFVALLERTDLDPISLPGAPKVACIGPVTAQAARDLGFHVDVVAEPHTAEGLVMGIQSAERADG